MNEARPEGIERYYIENRSRLLAFIRGKVTDDTLAEDILQDSLLKALRSAPDLEDSDRLVPWLYRIIRNSITDTYRREGALRKKLESVAPELDGVILPPEDETALCGCLIDLLPTLKPEYAEVLEAMDLGDVSTEEMTTRLGITPNNLKVRRFRARKQLKERLERTCRTCATHGCLDCTCGGR